MIAVFKREYLSAVRKKMFIVMTFLLPLLMGGFMYVVIGVASRGLGVKKVAVIDGTGALRETFSKPVVAEDETPKTAAPVKRPRKASSLLDLQYVDAHNETDLDAATKPYLSRLSSDDKNARLDGVFVIPSHALDNSETTLKYYSRSATDFIAQERLSSMTNRAIQKQKLAARGISGEELDRVMKSMNVDAVQLSKSGEQKKGGAQNFFVGFILTALLIIPSFIYGLEVMRGIIQEKTDRVVEVLISSMSSTQLLIGKILGVAAVGLTQIGVWMLMALGAATFGLAVTKMAGEDVLQLRAPGDVRLLRDLLHAGVPDVRLRLRDRRRGLQLREGSAAAHRPDHHGHDAAVVPAGRHHHESRLEPLGRLLAGAGVRPDDDVRPHAGRRPADVAHRAVDRGLDRDDHRVLLGHGEDLPGRNPLVRQATDDPGAVAVAESGVRRL